MVSVGPNLESKNEGTDKRFLHLQGERVRKPLRQITWERDEDSVTKSRRRVKPGLLRDNTPVSI